jgi:hypothetical protein
MEVVETVPFVHIASCQPGLSVVQRLAKSAHNELNTYLQWETKEKSSQE